MDMSNENGQSELKQTPEQEQELKLRSKYPNPQKPGGSVFIQKMLHKGNKKYFDSGDYNMAKSRNKALGKQPTSNTTQTTTIIEQHHIPSITDDYDQSDTSLNTPSISILEQCAPTLKCEQEILNCVMSNSQSSISLSNSNFLSASISTEKINSKNNNSNLDLDSEEIGQGIPTPEYLHLRKHSITQSKLVTS